MIRYKTAFMLPVGTNQIKITFVIYYIRIFLFSFIIDKRNLENRAQKMKL